MVRVQHLLLASQVINEVNVVCSSPQFYSFGHVSSKPLIFSSLQDAGWILASPNLEMYCAIIPDI